MIGTTLGTIPVTQPSLPLYRNMLQYPLQPGSDELHLANSCYHRFRRRSQFRPRKTVTQWQPDVRYKIYNYISLIQALKRMINMIGT